FLIAFVLLFTADCQDAVLKRKRDIILVDPRKFSFDHDFLVSLRHVHVWSEGKASTSTCTKHARESWQATQKAVEQAIHLRPEDAYLKPLEHLETDQHLLSHVCRTR